MTIITQAQITLYDVFDGQNGGQGIQGVAGKDGQTLYTWLKYSDSPTTGMSDSPTGKKYLGIAYNKTSATESTSYSDYAWSLIEGTQGIQGVAGADGKPKFTWVKYADTPTTGMNDLPTGKKYLGLAYNKDTSVESTNYADYSWSLIQGEKGDVGESTYTWVKYADDVNGNGMSDTPEGKRFLGLAYNKSVQTESNVASDYSWSSLYDDKIAQELKDYVQSRGENLVTNGTGLLGDNTNFSQFTFDGSEVFAGGGSFYTDLQNGTRFNDEMIPIDATKKYRLSLMSKSKEAIGKVYFGVVSYDIDGNIIMPYNVYGSIFQSTTLAKDLKFGDTEIHLTSSDGFVDNQADGSHFHSIVLWGYKNSYGYEYPEGTYSRNYFSTGWNKGAINRTTHVITLSKPFSSINPNSVDGVYKAGHKVSPTQSGGNYQYMTASNVTVPAEWTYYEGTITGNGVSDKKFPYGTAFVKIMFLTNRNSSGGIAGDSLWVNSISFTDITSSMSYTWIRYALDDKGTAMSTSPTGRDYMGIAYNKATDVPSTNPLDYTWGLFRGEQGIQGIQGERGLQGETGLRGLQGETGNQGIQGVAGKDGISSYTHIAYSTSATGSTGFSVSDPVNKTYIGMYVDTIATDSTDPTKYKWTLIKGSNGSQGIQGVAGVDGKTPYFHVAYSTSPTGATGFSVSDSVGKTYIGQYTDFLVADSTNPALYKWTLIKGEKGDTGERGLTGLQGATGNTGIQGVAGKDGLSSYTHIAYSDSADGVTNFSVSDSNRKYIGMYVDNIATDSNTPSKYNWTLVKGADGSQGIQGVKGSDGLTPYLHIAYATNSTGTLGFSTTDSVNKTYIGTYTDNVSADSNTPSLYSWSLIKGDKGDKGDTGSTGERGLQGLQGNTGATGIQGVKGADGVSSYTHIAYSTSPTGATGFSVSDPVGKTYMGMYVDSIATDSTTPSKYKWSLIKGADGSQGIAGTKGADGLTPYLHIAYATNSTGTTGFSTTDSTGKTYIGTYTDFVSADSSTPSKYLWTQIKGDKGDKGDQGDPNSTIVNAVTTIDGTGITVKDGNFGLESSRGGSHQIFIDGVNYAYETKDFKNHLLTLPNMLYDHSFEMLESNGIVSGYNHHYMKTSPSEMWGRWGTSGTPRLHTNYGTDSTFMLVPFGEQMAIVNFSNYVRQGVVGINANQKYTLSFHISAPSDLPSANLAEIYFKYVDAYGYQIGSTNYAQFSVPLDLSYNESVRNAITFTVPNVVSNYDGVFVEIGFRTTSTSYACFDGIQLVLGDKAVLYYPDDEAWKIRRGGKDKYPVIDDIDGGHIKINQLEVSGTTLQSGNIFLQGNAVITTTDRSWLLPTLGSGITAYGGVYEYCRYYKDAQGFVHIRGFLKGVTTGATLFTLPVGYRPALTRIFSTFSNSATNSSRIDIQADGKVIATYSGAWCLLDGIYFNT